MKAFGGLRVVIFDEFDGMTRQSMETMRNTMEEYIDNSRFILTCNYERKIIDPIKSRCQMFDFTCADEGAQRVSVIKRCAEILKAEAVTSPNLKADLMKLTKKYFPDIRRTINALQKHTVGGVFEYKEELEGTATEARLLDLIREMDIRTIRKEILGNVDYNDLYRILFNRAGELHEEKKLSIMLIVGDAARWHSIVLDPEINFVTCLVNVCTEIGKE
jgi:DNA polymerase III delta prime subunit